jgi:hypothetical protein
VKNGIGGADAVCFKQQGASLAGRGRPKRVADTVAPDSDKSQAIATTELENPRAQAGKRHFVQRRLLRPG